MCMCVNMPNNERIDSYPTSKTFGIIYHEQDDKCLEHLEYCKENQCHSYPGCIKCFESYASLICAKHSKCMIFCSKCMDESNQYQKLAKRLGHQKLLARLSEFYRI